MTNKIVNTPHGTLKTPFFMPDATRGFVKLLDSQDLKMAGVEAMVVNTFHLYLQPGIKIIKQAGGIHNFINWQKPLLSDSGGFQVFSLIHRNKKMGKIYDDRVEFHSPLDGSKHVLTPEKSIQIQFDLGVDMMVCLDDCPPNDCGEKGLKLAVDHTIAWAKRCAVEYEKQVKKRKLLKEKNKPLIFCVVQGGADLELRKKCLDGLVSVAPSNGWDGFGFGAMPVDKEGKFLEEVLSYTANLIPQNALCFALGIGTPEDIVRCVKLGWDMFDCVIPTREGRHGRLFEQITNYKLQITNKSQNKPEVSEQKSKIIYKSYNINNAKFKTDFSGINSDSKIPELRNYSKAYLNHVFRMNDPLAQRLASLNNLEIYNNLLKKLRIIK
jgi:queuine tRNA-ribosyltransferase